MNRNPNNIKTTFINGDGNLVQRGHDHLESCADDFKKFMTADQIEDVDDLGSFYDYGLSADYVAPETFEDQKEGYFRYQLSWGGPSEEIRFYYSPGAHNPYQIEFVFLDWFSGVGFDVTDESWAIWRWDYSYSCDLINSEFQIAMS